MSGLMALQAGLFEAITSDVNVYLSLVILTGAVIAGLSGKASVAGFGGFLVFAKIGTETDLFIWTGALYLTVGALLVFTAFQLWSFVSGDSLES